MNQICKPVPTNIAKKLGTIPSFIIGNCCPWSTSLDNSNLLVFQDATFHSTEDGKHFKWFNLKTSHERVPHILQIFICYFVINMSWCRFSTILKQQYYCSLQILFNSGSFSLWEIGFLKTVCFTGMANVLPVIISMTYLLSATSISHQLARKTMLLWLSPSIINVGMNRQKENEHIISIPSLHAFLNTRKKR